MAFDQRDYYRDWWRKKTGYVERASFRISEGDHKRQKHKSAWRRIWIKVLILCVLLVAVVVVKRM